jgi:hypothetical protein
MQPGVRAQSTAVFWHDISHQPERNHMKGLGLVLIALGVIGLAYGGFTYTKRTEKASIGPLEISVKDKETVNIPMWAGIACIVVGAGVLVMGGKKT